MKYRILKQIVEITEDERVFLMDRYLRNYQRFVEVYKELDEITALKALALETLTKGRSNIMDRLHERYHYFSRAREAKQLGIK